MRTIYVFEVNGICIEIKSNSINEARHILSEKIDKIYDLDVNIGLFASDFKLTKSYPSNFTKKVEKS